MPTRKTLAHIFIADSEFQLTITCSKSTIEKLKKGVKYVKVNYQNSNI